jgi:hypothetical protein
MTTTTTINNITALSPVQSDFDIMMAPAAVDESAGALAAAADDVQQHQPQQQQQQQQQPVMLPRLEELKQREAELAAQLAAVRREKLAAIRSKPLTIGIVGFGRFGQFIGTLLLLLLLFCVFAIRSATSKVLLLLLKMNVSYRLNTNGFA